MDYCLYHNADYDGWCSANIVKKAHPKVKLYGINYPDCENLDLTKFSGKQVCMVDFCLQPFNLMVDLNSLCDLTWIDHHASAIGSCNNLGLSDRFKGLRENGKAGCELTWTYFFPSKPIPLAVYYLGRYDVWDHKPNVLEFQYGLRSTGITVENNKQWEALLISSPSYRTTAWIESIVERGRIILDYTKDQNKGLMSLAEPVMLDGHLGIAVNCPRINSMAFDSVYPESDYEFMCSYYQHKGKWHVSLYSTKIDVSVIAKSYGGGGHKQASGFSCNQLPFKLNEGTV